MLTAFIIQYLLVMIGMNYEEKRGYQIESYKVGPRTDTNMIIQLYNNTLKAMVTSFVKG